jgi:hypothetical protein
VIRDESVVTNDARANMGGDDANWYIFTIDHHLSLQDKVLSRKGFEAF